MIKLLFFCLLLGTLSTSEVGTMEILLFDGIGYLKLQETSLKEVQKMYPEVKITKHWEKREFPEIIGRFRKSINFENAGFILRFYQRKHTGNYFISTIILTELFKGKTIDGIGIGSSYQDIVKVLGKNRLIGSTNSISIVYIEKRENRRNGVGSITFSCSNALADTASFKVDKIILR